MLLNAAWRMYFHSCQGDGRRGETLHCSGMLLPAHNRSCRMGVQTDEGEGGNVGGYVCVAVEQGEEVGV